jgi:hypothetical protein
MLILDLFCGTKSLLKPCNDLGFEYFGVDIDKEFNPDLVADINFLNINMLPKNIDVIWASPPCEHFSVASIGRHWNKDNTPKTKNAETSLCLVKNMLQIIRDINPRYYFIENPRGKLRVLDVMNNVGIRNTVTYCQYGDFRMKPTDIWTNSYTWKPKPICKNGDPCHVSAPRGSVTGTQGKMKYKEKSKVPYDLLYEILKSCVE